MMNTLRSHFTKHGSKYTPVQEETAAADKDTLCIHCGEAARPIDHSPKQLLRTAGKLLALVLLVLLSVAVDRETRYFGRDRLELAFMKAFGDGQYNLLHCR